MRMTAFLARRSWSAKNTATEIRFPYRFGGVDSPKDGFVPAKTMIGDGPRARDIIDGVKLAYKGLLTALGEGDTTGLKTMVERRLYKRFDEDLAALKKQARVLRLLNRDAPIIATLAGAYMITGGYIDRDREIAEKINKSEMGPDPERIIYTCERATRFQVLVKLRVMIESACRLDLADSVSGKSVVAVGAETEKKRPEVHELLVEGVMMVASVPKSIRQWLELFRALKELKMLKFEEATIVDIDGALKGNCHKDSDNI